MSTAWKPVAASAIVGVQVGAALVATRHAVVEAGPIFMALLRYSIALLCLLPFALRVMVPIARRDLLPVLGIGVLQFAVMVALQNWAMLYIPAARAALIFAATPLLTLLLAGAMGRESLTLPKLAGVLVTMAGVALVLGEQALAGGGRNEWLGSATAMCTAVLAALCSLAYRPYLMRYPTLPVSVYAMAASVVFLAAMAAAEGSLAAPPAMGLSTWGAVVFTGFASGGGYFLWLWALANTTPTRVSVFLSLGPVTAALLGALLLAEPITAMTVLALVAVALGLWLSHR